MKALVTGATGFIGSHLVESLIAKKYEVICTVRPTSDLVWLKGLNCRLVQGDITDRESLIAPVREAEYIFHVGGITKAKKEADYYKINADGSRILYEVCLEHNPGIKKIVHLSSLAAGGAALTVRPRNETDTDSPLTYYGKSKLEGEKYALQYSKLLPITILRPPAVYGPREKDIFFYFQLISKHLKPQLGWNKKYLSMIYVSDLVNAILLAAEAPKSNGQIYYVDDGCVYSWQDLSMEIQRAMQTWTLPLLVPEWLITVAAYIGEAWASLTSKPALLNRQKIIELKQKSWATSSEKIRNELGFQSEYDLKKGCTETVKWYREQGWIKQK
ncbi:NAD-dependent epimerase/dehydratase family protein [bacterium]|nr:NAD-dependent epimerase/dehydratase family protein [bacterium]